MPERILLVEDSTAMREVTAEFLRDEGYEVDAAEDGSAGLALLENNEYSLVLTDLRLPGADGFAIVEKANECLPHTPKIIMTAYSEIDDALRALRLGAYDFIQKPIRNMWELGVLLNRALDHRRLMLERQEHEKKIEQMNTDLQRLNTDLEAEVRRRTEELVRANRQLRTLDEMKNNLLANVSHELRTPLVSVRGYTELFLTGKLCDIPEDCRKYLTTSLRNIDKLLSLIESLVNYAEVARGAVRLELDVIDLGELATRLRDQSAETADAKQITLEVGVPDHPVPVHGDRKLIAEALEHIIDNAIKFSPEASTVRILVDLVGKRLVKFTVMDQGPGIPITEQARIFERFYQIDSSATRHHGGTGMGLAIARDNLRLNGCELRVGSEPGKGCTFYFTIPVLQPEELAEIESLRSGSDT